jgi:hypothetical protein
LETLGDLIVTDDLAAFFAALVVTDRTVIITVQLVELNPL